MVGERVDESVDELVVPKVAEVAVKLDFCSVVVMVFCLAAGKVR